ncbi:MAG: hypothetical protein GY832_15995 [Chloroflexi bacterium]|nr:hypothetical protein [Chloroflexota bacterium]
MSENKVKEYKRKVTPLERMFARSPYSIVTMVARIKGNVSESMLKHAVSQVQQRHPNLRVRIEEDNDHNLWFTSEGAGEIPIEIVPRESDDHWMQVFHEACQVPFEFEERPAIRFILVQSPKKSELIIFCHHIICDGLSLAYLARDLMVHLGDPTRKVEVLPNPVLIDRDTMPKDVSMNAIVKFFMNRINQKWQNDQIFFDQEDYADLNQAYWNKYTHQMLAIELSKAQTTALVERCRKENVTVNSALTAAFVGAQTIVQGEKPHHSSIGVAGSLRDRLQRPIGQVMGFYAGITSLKYKYNGKSSFWENARRVHQKVKPLYTNKNLFQESLTWCYLDLGILEALTFKMIGGLVPPHATRYDKLSAFSKRDDLVSSILKREKMDSLDQIIMGTAVTNLTRMDFPTEYGALGLDRLIMNPGGAFPLAMVNIVLGAVTCAGKLSLLVEYAEETIDTSTMEKVKDKAMEFLLEDS